MIVRNRLWSASFVAAAALAGAGAAHANLLVNGSFENATNFVNNTGQGAMLLSVGDPAVTGWNLVGGGTLLWAGPGSFSYMGGVAPNDGNYFLDLTGLTNQPPYAGVSQTVNTAIGQLYTLTFDWGGRSDSTPVSITASAGAASQSFSTGAIPWTTQTFQFAGTGGATAISLVGTFAGGSQLSLHLDNVRLDATGVPEPRTWALQILGFAAAGTAFRLRKRDLTLRRA